MTLHKNADRVASIFVSASDQGGITIFGGLVGALVVGIYTAITWAGVQLAAVIAGYVQVRTGTGSLPG